MLKRVISEMAGEYRKVCTEVLISLIIPVYNADRYLEQCLESVVGQSVPLDEVILINDGSTDDSLSICEQYCRKYQYFKLINQENKGLSEARNRGLECACGEYVLFLDSDDYLEEDAVRTLKGILGKSGLDAVYFDADIECEEEYEVSENNFIRKSLKSWDGIRMSGEMFFRKCYPDSYTVPVWLAIYKKQTIEATGILFPKGLYYEDVYFTFAFMMRAKDVCYISRKLYRRRYRKDSIITSAYTEKKFIDLIKIVLLVWEDVRRQKDVFLPQNKVFLNFLNDYCSIGLKHRCLCEDNGIKIGKDAQSVFDTMIKAYETLAVQCSSLEHMEYLNVFNAVLKNIREIERYCSGYMIRKKNLIDKLCQRQKQFYKELLCVLPLNDEAYKVGIYGSGKHTEGLLAVYERLIGKISCNLVFIDSYKENGSYLGRQMIHYRKIDSSFNMIIISSYIYRKEMIENIKNIDKSVPLYTFYDTLDEDVFSGWIDWNG